MRIYLDTGKLNNRQISRITEVIETQGHTIEVAADLKEKFDFLSPKADIAKGMKDLKTVMSTCNAFVFDASQDVGEYGYVLGMALNQKSKVLLIKDKVGKPRGELIEEVVYKEETVKGDIERFLGSVEISKPFLFIIPTELKKYVEWASAFRHMHMSEIVRGAIEAQMDRDKDWKLNLKN